MQVPVLTDGDIVLYESDAIIYYLEETYPDTPLLPSDKKERALALVSSIVKHEKVHCISGKMERG
jgi:glutathione S-transferase